jgi:hypothetical protein
LASQSTSVNAQVLSPSSGEVELIFMGQQSQRQTPNIVAGALQFSVQNNYRNGSICTKDFGRVSGRPDSHVLWAKIPAIPAMRARVRVPESQKVHGILGGIPGESGI